MKPVWKWVIGIAIVLVIIAIGVGVVFAVRTYLPFNRTVVQAVRIIPRSTTPSTPGSPPNYFKGPGFGGPRFSGPGYEMRGHGMYGFGVMGRGMNPVGGLIMGLFGLGVLIFLVLGIIWLVRSLRAPKLAVTMASCPKCGKPVQADWSNCPYCGKKL